MKINPNEFTKFLVQNVALIFVVVLCIVGFGAYATYSSMHENDIDIQSQDLAPQ